MNIIEHETKGIGTWKEKEDELFIELERNNLFFWLSLIYFWKMKLFII